MNLQELLGEREEDLKNVEALLNDHDCHASQEDGCECDELRDEIDDLKTEIYQIEVQMDNNLEEYMFDEDEAKGQDLSFGSQII